MQSRLPGDTPGHEDANNLYGSGFDPIFSKSTRLQFLYALETKRNVIVHGQIGSHLATILPRLLVEAGWTANGKSIAVALPGQVAALKSAVRAARENGLDDSHVGGDIVGYVIDSNVKRSSSTKVVFYSNHALLQTILREPLLSSSAVIVIADFQDRGVTVDLLLGLLKGIQRIRQELRLVLTTTALGAEDIRSFLGPRDSTIVQVPSALHPVDILHATAPMEDYHEGLLQAVKDCFSKWNRNGRPQSANVLVFVKGAAEAEAVSEKVNNWYSEDVNIPTKRRRSHQPQSAPAHKSAEKAALLIAVPLHPGLSLGDQIAALRYSPFERRLRVVIASSIAEAAVTVEGITTVIDCGFERTTVYNPTTKTSVVSTVPISHSSANWRASRAGLTAPGICIRLYTSDFFQTKMADCRPPEILRGDLTDMVLSLKAIGFTNVMSFDFLTAPKEELVVDSLARLYFLGALTTSAHLTTPLGLRMSASRLSPQLMKSLIVAESYGVERQITAIAAMLQIKEVVFQHGRRVDKSRNPFAVAEGDLITLLNVWRRYVDSGCSDSWCAEHGINARAMQKAKRSFIEIVKSQMGWGSKTGRSGVGRKALGLSTEERVCRSIAAGFCEHLAMVEADGGYLLGLSGRRTRIHRGSVLRGRMPRWVVYVDLSQYDEVCEMREVTVVQPEWIVEYAPELFEMTAAG